MLGQDRWGESFGRLNFTSWNSLFRDHEIYVRTGGHVRFLHLSAVLQRRVATLVLAVATAWALGTLALLGWQAWTSWKTRDMDERAAAVAFAERQVKAERQSVEGIANTLDARQDRIEELFKSHFGEAPAEEAAKPASETPAQPAKVSATSAISVPNAQVARLLKIGSRQEMLLDSLTDIARQRIVRAEKTLQMVGLKPRAGGGQGGPFLPFLGRKKSETEDPALDRLAETLERMERLEALLIALPSGSPTDRMDVTSGFGYRRDPFNGHAALHAGLDFRGGHGAAIRSAAPGRVSFVGVKSGYGNVVEVSHGHGLITRYAHLSGFNARVGQKVVSGEQIARMGSTGRSTGTHLHFEVRVNGAAVNPRRFLEANAHVLEIKDARSRAVDSAAA